MLLDSEICVHITNGNKAYYKDKGFDINNEYIMCLVSDLPPRASTIVNAECDYCHETVKVKYGNYNKSIDVGGKYACKKCRFLKQQEMLQQKYGVSYTWEIPDVKEKIKLTMLEKYGEDNAMKIQEFKEKARHTSVEKYGCEYPIQNETIKEKMYSTNLEKYGEMHVLQLQQTKDKMKNTMKERYGVENAMQSPIIQEKAKKTNLEKYGCEYPSQNEEIKNKAKQTNMKLYGCENVLNSEYIKDKIRKTMLDKYGVENAMYSLEIKEKLEQANLKKYGYKNTLQVPEIRHKQRVTMYKNKTVPSSTQQNYLCDLYQGKLNYPCGHLSLDIALDNIDIEYNGSGHDLSVVLDDGDYNKFIKKEMNRSYYIKNQGYKQMIIISKKDRLPSDDILLYMLDISKKYFQETNHTWIKFDIDTSSMINAEHQEGVFFNFGELRKIKKEAV